MNTMKSLSLGASALTLLGLVAGGAHAASVTLNYTDDNNIISTGAKTNPYVIEVSGSGVTGNGGPSFSVIDYQANIATAITAATGVSTPMNPIPTTPLTGNQNLSLSLGSASGSFQTTGLVDVYVASNVKASIDNTGTAPNNVAPGAQSVASTLTYLPGTTTALGVGSQLGTLGLLGAFTTVISPQMITTYNLSATGAAAALLDSEVNAGDLRLVLTADPNSPTVATEFPGYNYTGAITTDPTNGPLVNRLVITSAVPTAAVPETGTFALLGLGLLPAALLAAKRRKAA